MEHEGPLTSSTRWVSSKANADTPPYPMAAGYQHFYNGAELEIPVMEEVSLVRSAAAIRYLLSIDEIEGWLSADAALAVIELGWEQARLGLSSGMAEIGVHHGKSFLALAACAERDEKLIAVDIFERQDLNVDYSGCGNREVFLANVAKFFPGVEPRLIAEPSEHLRGHEAAHGLSGLRFISIDGGHTAALTLNDLQIADAALAPAGICALDDVLNAHWTGVLTGLFHYFETGASLLPFCLVPNKLLLCRPQLAENYRHFMESCFSYAQEKQNLEFGPAKIDVYGKMWSGVNKTFSHLAKLAVAGHSLDAQETRCKEAEERLESILASTSWRLTAPLRRMVRFVRSGLDPRPGE